MTTSTPSPQAEQLREALIDEAYHQGYGGIPMTLIALVGLTIIHWINAAELLNPWWLAGAVLLNVVRLLTLIRFARDRQKMSVRQKEVLFIVPLILMSLLWGALAPLTFGAAGMLEKLAMACVLSGMAGGAATVLAPLRWPGRFYLICILGPVSILVFDLQGGGPALSGLGLAFLIIMFLSHAQARRMLVDAKISIFDKQMLLNDAYRQQEVVRQLNSALENSQQTLRDQNDHLEKLVEERTTRIRLAFSVIENTAEAVMVITTDGEIIEVNPAFCRITGYAPEEIIGKPANILQASLDDQSAYANLWRELNESGKWTGELWSARKDGSLFLERRSMDAVRDKAGKVTHYVAVASDVTDAHHKDEQLRHMASHDPLTGLPNRSLLLEKLEQGIAQAGQHAARLGVLFLDLDHFKSINDSLGHHIGDILLREISVRLKGCIRLSDTLARLGGDEFVVIMNNVRDNEDCARLAQILIAALQPPIALSESIIHIRTSIGIAVYPDDSEDANTLMKNADMALYAAKAAGRGTFAFFQPSMSAQANQRLEFEFELREAITRRELKLHYQAKIHAKDLSVEGYEALIRWNHPKKGLITPDQFIPMAEAAGLIDLIDHWVVSEACRQIADWHDRGFGWQRVAVNISSRQFQHENLVALFLQAGTSHGIPATLIEVEVTESFIMTHPEKAIATLQALQAAGITVAIDDFGTGHSSLAYLRTLPIDVVKIDRMFIMEAENDPVSQAIIKAIVDLCTTLDLEVVAEGVETRALVDMLCAAGCYILQGHYFSSAVAPETLEAHWAQSSGGKPPFASEASKTTGSRSP
jgi:diguanylate cyclase (GGDEF)-like protein/PAS domain S-box-containing protein